VFGNARIIERTTTEVNAMFGESPKVFLRVALARTLIAIVALALVLSTSCGSRERQADRLYRKASQAVEDGNLDEAVALFEQIVDDYGDTKTAPRARDAMKLYRGLSYSEKVYPTSAATDVMIATAKALERYRRNNGRFPDGLSSIVPRYVDAVPVDSWGQDLVYRVKSGGKGYVLASYGSDASPGGAGDASDIVIEDSKFVRRAETP